MPAQPNQQANPSGSATKVGTSHLVTMVIPIFNQAGATRSCLEAIVTNTADHLYNGMLINNGSTEPETLQLINALDGDVQIIHLPSHLDFFQACNQARAHVDGEYVLLLEQTAIPQPGWLDALIHVMQSDESIGMVAAQLINRQGERLQGCSEGCLLIRRSLFEKLQGFPLVANPFHALCTGIRQLGYRIQPCPEAIILHDYQQLTCLPWQDLTQPLPSGRERFSGLIKNQAFATALDDFITNPVVLLELNSQCNFRCDYCRSPQSPRQKSFMKKELFIHILNQLKDITTQPLRLHVDGEPTLHPDFVACALMANQAGYPIALATNGSTLRPEFLQIDMAVILNLSCSAEELSPRTGMAFEVYSKRLVDYIRAWMASDSRQTLFFKIYTSTEERHAPGALEQKQAFAHQFIKQCGLEHGEWKNNTVSAFDYIATNQAGGVFSLSNIPRTEGGCYPTTSALPAQLLPDNFGFCDSAWKTLAILSDGTVAYCCVDLFGETGFTEPDEIWKTSLKDIWLHHPKIVQARQELLDGKITIPACQKCLEIAPGRELYLWPEAFPFESR